MAKLTVCLLHGALADGTPRTFVVHRGRRRVIGSGSAADIPGDRMGVSKVHARIDWEDDDPVIADAGSAAGTYVDAGAGLRRIGGDAQRLAHGDVIACGPSRWTVDRLQEPAVGRLEVADLSALWALTEVVVRAAGSVNAPCVAIPEDVRARLWPWLTEEPRGRSLVLADLRQWLCLPGLMGLGKEVFLDAWTWVERRDRRRTHELLRLTCQVETVDRMDPFSQQLERRSLTIDRVTRRGPGRWYVAGLFTADDVADLERYAMLAPQLFPRPPLAAPLAPWTSAVRNAPPRRGSHAARALLALAAHLHACGYQRLYLRPLAERTDPVWRLQLTAHGLDAQTQAPWTLEYASSQGERFFDRPGAVGLQVADLARWIGGEFPAFLDACAGDDPLNAEATLVLLQALGDAGLPALPAEGDIDGERIPPWVVWARDEVVELPKLPWPLRERRIPRFGDGVYQMVEDDWGGFCGTPPT